jgi:hypothetical protein
MEISMEPIQFLNFENCVGNKFLKFDFKAIGLTQEMACYFPMSPSTNSYQSWHGYILISDNLNGVVYKILPS